LGILIISSVFIFPIIGPDIAKNILNRPSHSPDTHTGVGNQSEVIMRIDPGVPYLHFENNQVREPSFAPNIHSEDFKCYSHDGKKGECDSYFKLSIPQNSSLVLGYDIVSHGVMFVQISKENITSERHYLTIYAKPFNNNSFVNIGDLKPLTSIEM